MTTGSRAPSAHMPVNASAGGHMSAHAPGGDDEYAGAPDRDGEVLTTAEVARLFRVARSTVISWAYRGLLPYTTTPTGYLRFYRDSIERLRAERRGPAGECPTDGDPGDD